MASSFFPHGVRFLFAAPILLALAPALAMAQDSPLVGTWKLVAADVQRPDGRVLPDYGSAPTELAIFTADGQYMLEICTGQVNPTIGERFDRLSQTLPSIGTGSENTGQSRVRTLTGGSNAEDRHTD